MKFLTNDTQEILTQGQVRKRFSNVSIPKVFTQDTYDALNITPILETPKPTPSSDAKVVVQNGTTVDAQGNTVFNWVEQDMFTTDENGTKAEKEAAYRAEQLAKAKESKLEQLSNLALEKEQAGITVASLDISTKREDQFRITQALNLMGRKSGATQRFKAKNGWATANKATLEAIEDALEAHIDAVSTQHEAHENAINALTTVQEVQDYDFQIGW